MGRLKVQRLDRRHSGYGVWGYHVTGSMGISTLRDCRNQFYSWREWCWTTWGPSKELDRFEADDLFDGMHSSNPHWCWVNDNIHGFRIYLKGDEEAALFTLKWT